MAADIGASKIKIAVFYALDAEMKPTLAMLGRRMRLEHGNLNRFDIVQAGQTCFIKTGMGVKNSAQAAREFLYTFRPEIVISAGFGGMLLGKADIGKPLSISAVELYPEGGKLELPDTGLFTGLRKAPLITISQWTRKAVLKEKIRQKEFFLAIDMETFPLASMCLERKIRFAGIRAVTDGEDMEIDFTPEDVSDESGYYSASKAAWLIAKRPALLPQALKLGANSRKAAEAICQALLNIL
ncbi:MAG: hypothetical protein M0Z52_04805 [Actinomycetota bacterium]|nr:hypothetical protein [Actinomycetota bacterium]